MSGPARASKGRSRLVPVAALLLCAALFAALGLWQVKRLAWKEALIAQVSANTTAAPLDVAALPRPLDPAAQEYRRIRLAGRFVPQATVLVAATSDLGNGYWDMVPLAIDGRAPVYINRGFVPLGSRVGQIAAATPTGRVTVVGLLRKSEPHGSFLRPNRPQDDRWYGRDIAAMAAARHIASEPAWFVDAQAENPAPPAAQAPVPGLTVIAFPNNHLSYALTWFALCALSLGLAVFIGRGRL